MSFESAENAIRAWIKSGSGFVDANVYFNDQKIERPNVPHVTIRLGDPVTLGAVDAVIATFDEDRPVGEEFEHRVDGQRQLSASIQIWRGKTTGAGTAMSIAHQLQLAIRLPSINTALNVAGLGVLDVGTVRNLSGLLDSDFEGRAQFDVVFHYRESIAEYTTYIETAVVTDRDTDEEFVLVES